METKEVKRLIRKLSKEAQDDIMIGGAEDREVIISALWATSFFLNKSNEQAKNWMITCKETLEKMGEVKDITSKYYDPVINAL